MIQRMIEYINQNGGRKIEPIPAHIRRITEERQRELNKLEGNLSTQIDTDAIQHDMRHSRRMLRLDSIKQLKRALFEHGHGSLVLDQILAENVMASKTLREAQHLLEQIAGAEGHNRVVIDYLQGRLKSTLELLD